MKKIFKYAWLMAAALTVGLWSCSNHDDVPDNGGEDVTPVEGVETNLYLTLQFPGTYATTRTDSGTADESVINTLDLFILNADGSQLITRKRVDDGSVNNGSTITVTTSSGNRLIFAAVNLPDEFLTQIIADKLDAVNDQTEYEVTVAQLTAEYGFVMFSSEVSAVTLWTTEELSADASLSNDISLDMVRMVGKVGTVKGSALNQNITGYANDGDPATVIGEVDLNTLAFTLGTVNKYTYAIQNLVYGVPQDPNHIGYDATHSGDRTSAVYGNDDFSPWGVDLPADYTLVNDFGTSTTNGDMEFKYAPENTADLGLQGSNTYVSIRAQFSPADMTADDGSPAAAYTVGDDFWMVTYTGQDDQQENVTISKFFHTEQDALDYCNSEGITFTPVEYKDGYCYYNVYPGRDDGYNFYRNTFYQVNVTAINSIGNPDPAPIDPDQPIDGEKIDILVEINIVPWTFIEEDHELGK